jgi:hypothetical protein
VKEGLYALRRKKFRLKQFFTSEDAAKVRVRGKNSFGEEEHNQGNRDKKTKTEKE